MFKVGFVYNFKSEDTKTILVKPVFVMPSL